MGVVFNLSARVRSRNSWVVFCLCVDIGKNEPVVGKQFFQFFFGEVVGDACQYSFFFWGGKISYLGNYNDRGLVLVMRNNEAIISI